MSDDAWDNGEEVSLPVKGATDKWEGEDEDEDVKDSWDKSDDSESEADKKNATVSDQPPAQKAVHKKKVKLADRIAAKEGMINSDLEDISPEAKLLEKMRLQKLEEASNLQIARDMLGVQTGSVDSLVPVTKEDFEEFAKAIIGKVTLFSNSEHYNDMVENIIKEIAVDLNTRNLKKIKIHIDGLHSVKLKEEKSKSKPKAAKTKGVVKMDLDKDIYDGNFDDDGTDDFM